MPLSRQPSLPVETYLKVVDGLLAAWENPHDCETPARIRTTTHLVFALVANAYRAGRAAVVLWENDLWSESVPSVRACLESAIYAAWTQQTGSKGVEAAFHERARQNRALLRSATKASLIVPEEIRDDIEQARLGPGSGPKPGCVRWGIPSNE